MRCCVQNCFNDDSKKTNKSRGITFHKLPKHQDHSAAWLAAVARLGCRMKKRFIICSEHFLPEDFDDTLLNSQGRRVKSGAVPTVMAPAVQEELKVCRVCLALDVKMYNMKDFKLSEMFQNITGILAIDKQASILQRVCWECAARLTAAAAFIEKALLSDALLKVHAHITKCEIATIKQNHPSLKSPLTVQPVFTISDIEWEHAISENKEIEDITNDEIKELTKIKMTEEDIEFGDDEPLIDVAVKVEAESDPIAINNMQFQDRKSDTLLEQTLLNYTSPRDDNEDEITNTEVQFNNNNDKILREDIQNEIPMINDDNLSIVIDNDNVKIKPKLDDISNVMDESSSEEDTQSTADEEVGEEPAEESEEESEEEADAEEVSVCKAKKKMSSKVVTKKGATIGNNEGLKAKIIALKKQGLSVPAIAKETGVLQTSITALIQRYQRDRRRNRRTNASGQNFFIIDSDSDQGYNYNPEPGKEMGACSATVRRRLYQAGLEHILMKKPERSENMVQKQNISTEKTLHEDLKQRIVALKQEGLTNTSIAYLLECNRNTVHKWWTRWCKEGHMVNHKITGRDRKTTAQEDQLLIERVAREQTIHTASLAKELGVSAKVDAVTKQKIISMKHNGFPVTYIANQFRVTRTSVYLWWRRWCKENNIKTTSDNNTSTSTEQEQSLAEDTNVKKRVQMLPLSIISSKKS